MTERTLLWTVVDPRGLSVSLAADVWEHIVTEHDYMAPYVDAIRQTVEDPDEIYFDPRSTQIRKTGAQIYAYYRSEILTGLFQDKLAYVSVKIVQESSGLRGYVQTALSTSVVQKRMALIWTR